MADSPRLSTIHRPRVLAAPDKFKGTASAVDLAASMAAGAKRAGLDCVELPLADGGEGTLEALGGANRITEVTAPDGSTVAAEWRLSDGVAVIEMARASGLTLVGGADSNDPLSATTRGTGELIREAILSGAREIVVGVGGSATTDGGRGALEALDGLVPFSPDIDVCVAADVSTAFVDAARVFAPQKGASPEQVAQLRLRLQQLAVAYRHRFGVDVLSLAGGGAAGGLAGGLVAAGASIVSGFELVARHVGLQDALAGVDVVVTGEGHLDAGSFAGKVTGRVVDLAGAAGLPVLLIVGGSSLDEHPDHVTVVSLDTLYREAAWTETCDCVADAARRWLQSPHAVLSTNCD